MRHSVISQLLADYRDTGRLRPVAGVVDRDDGEDVFATLGSIYEWHTVIENGLEPAPTPGSNVAGVDLGEVHPAAITDGRDSLVVSCRELRSLNQYLNKRLAELKSLQSGKQKHSGRWGRIQRRINRFLAQNKQQRRDLEHKISRAVVDWSVMHQVGTLAIGDVR